TFSVCAAASLLAGILPALHRSRQADTLISTARSSASRALLLFQRGLMVAQIALGVGLLAAAGLLTHSLLHSSSVNPGFRVDNAIAFETGFPSAGWRESIAVSQRILDATRSTPGVVSAGWITNPPPETRAGVFLPFWIVGANTTPQPFCNFQVSSEDYFSTAGVAFSRGRDFTLADASTSPPVAIVNETLARQFFRDQDPIGKHISTPMQGNKTAVEIVGVIRDIHDRGLGAKATATVYVPFRQFALAYGGVVARLSAPPDVVIPELRRRVAQADPTIPLRAVSSIQTRLRATLDTPRFYTVMAVACAFMAILFVTLGLYGVISYAVSRRTSEVGIRMALGASRENILRGVIRQGLAIASLGLVFGLALALASTRLLRTLLFEIKPVDPATLSLAAALVVLVTLAASYFPARRASRVEPMTALRHE
ncbi:MAG TPA: FtsX-like permease family protein, partial [Bryobacteraceae bacterium]|nr:FtsX-like permease family protein [Bryobacteraceae bacterium]